MLTALVLGLALFLGVALPPASAQGRPPLDVAEIRSRIAALASAEVEEVVRREANRVYQEGLQELEHAAQADARAVGFRQKIEETQGLLAELRKATKDPGGRARPSADADLAELELLNQRATDALSQARAEIQRIQEEITRHTSRGAELAEALTRLERDETRLPSGAPTEGPALVNSAIEVLRRARRRAVKAEIAAAKAEQAYLKVRREYLPESLGGTKQEVAIRLGALKVLQQAVASRRQRDAAAREEEAARLEQEARQSPLIQEAANQLLRYTKLNTTLTAELTETEARLSKVRTGLNDQRGSFRIVRRKVDAAGVTEAMGFVLRNQLKGLDDPSELARDHDRIDARLSAVQFELITLEESRNALPEPAVELERLLSRLPPGAGLDSEVLRRVGAQVLEGRKRYVNSAVRVANSLFQRLVELDHLIGEKIKANAEYRSYVEERILWVPSVAGGGAPSPAQARAAAAWLVTSPTWSATFAEVFRSERALLLIALLLGFLVAVGLAAGAHHQLRQDREQAVDPIRRLQPGLRAAVLTVVRALPLPLALGIAGVTLQLPSGGVLGEHAVSGAVGAGLESTGVLLLGLLVIRGLLDPKGLSGVHLRWQDEGLRYVRRHLVWLTILKAAATFLVVALDDQPSLDNAYGDSLGRVAFVAGELGLAMFLALVFRPQGPALRNYYEAHPQSWLTRLRYVWLAVALGTPLVLAALALRGFYFTATSLDESLKASLGLVLALGLAGGLLGLWIESAQARRERVRAEEALEREEAMRRSQLEGLPVDEEAEDFYEIDALDEQLRQLFRVGAGLLLLIGLNLIWGDVLPALKRLDRVQIWPRIEVLKATTQTVHYPTLEGSDQNSGHDHLVEPAPVPTPTPGATAPGLGPSGLLPASPQTSGQVSDLLPARVTLADLGLALLLLFFTFAAARSLPALLELVLLPRLPLDVGARYAVATLSRYMIVLLGVSAGATALGIGWDNLQWLVAALTFGLAFGLQEIFANFVSGLIILFERPVRVGDQVTIGEVTGIVTRLRLRATTIRQEDDRELIVPNRELVTGQVINWSLSDSSLRISFEVGVAYGSDVLLVRRILLLCARRDRQVIRRPRPQALFLSFGESSLDFTLRIWVAHPAHRWDVKDRLHRAIDAAFRAEGVEIAFPQQDFHLKTAPSLAALVERLGPAPSPAPPDPALLATTIAQALSLTQRLEPILPAHDEEEDEVSAEDTARVEAAVEAAMEAAVEPDLGTTSLPESKESTDDAAEETTPAAESEASPTESGAGETSPDSTLAGPGGSE
ncbi:MAG: mechanosensitive ion channel [Planctomycetes bacterium]|nr:mechanosensitive ion channel [Planctomycetota bacterium]